MSKRLNKFPNKIITSNQSVDVASSPCKKCAYHSNSYAYMNQIAKHADIVTTAKNTGTTVDMTSQVNIKIALHFIAPKGSFDKNKVSHRAFDIVASVNEDFNSYTPNLNILNNFKYKSIINQVFTNNMDKQKTYLSEKYQNILPTAPANISFELGQIYYYPVKNQLSLSSYDDVVDVELAYNAVKQFIINSQAHDIQPESVLNIWVVDKINTSVLSFSSFPWDSPDGVHGIIINRRAFFPEEYNETTYDRYKTVTHAIGHYLGLIHVFTQGSTISNQKSMNMHADTNSLSNIIIHTYSDVPSQEAPTVNPLDKVANNRLHADPNYNPLFMNFMDYTNDKYVAVFTKNQLEKIRYMIATYRPKINSLTNTVILPKPKYNPDTDSILVGDAPHPKIVYDMPKQLGQTAPEVFPVAPPTHLNPNLEPFLSGTSMNTQNVPQIPMVRAVKPINPNLISDNAIVSVDTPSESAIQKQSAPTQSPAIINPNLNVVSTDYDTNNYFNGRMASAINQNITTTPTSNPNLNPNQQVISTVNPSSFAAGFASQGGQQIVTGANPPITNPNLVPANNILDTADNAIVFDDSQTTQKDVLQVDPYIGAFAPSPYHIGPNQLNAVYDQAFTNPPNFLPIANVSPDTVNATIAAAILQVQANGNLPPTGPVAPGLLQSVLAPKFTPQYGLKQLANAQATATAQSADSQTVSSTQMAGNPNLRPVAQSNSLIKKVANPHNLVDHTDLPIMAQDKHSGSNTFTYDKFGRPINTTNMSNKSFVRSAPKSIVIPPPSTTIPTQRMMSNVTHPGSVTTFTNTVPMPQQPTARISSMETNPNLNPNINPNMALIPSSGTKKVNSIQNNSSNMAGDQLMNMLANAGNGQYDVPRVSNVDSLGGAPSRKASKRITRKKSATTLNY